jgi:hypothetical protein
VRLHVSKGVGCAADDEFAAEQLAGFCYRHVVLAEVNPVGTDFFHQIHAVVNDESGATAAAQLKTLESDGANFFVGYVFHAELNPAATALKSHTDRVQIAEPLCVMGYELQHIILRRRL